MKHAIDTMADSPKQTVITWLFNPNTKPTWNNIFILLNERPPKEITRKHQFGKIISIFCVYFG